MKSIMKTTFAVTSLTTLTTPWKPLLEHLPILCILFVAQAWMWQAISPFDDASSATIPSIDEASTKKEKKKKTVQFSFGELPLDVRHFDNNSIINVLMEDLIPYTQMEAFLRSGRQPHRRGSH